MYSSCLKRMSDHDIIVTVVFLSCMCRTLFPSSVDRYHPVIFAYAMCYYPHLTGRIYHVERVFLHENASQAEPPSTSVVRALRVAGMSAAFSGSGGRRHECEVPTHNIHEWQDDDEDGFELVYNECYYLCCFYKHGRGCWSSFTCFHLTDV